MILPSGWCLSESLSTIFDGWHSNLPAAWRGIYPRLFMFLSMVIRTLCFGAYFGLKIVAYEHSPNLSEWFLKEIRSSNRWWTQVSIWNFKGVRSPVGCLYIYILLCVESCPSCVRLPFWMINSFKWFESTPPSRVTVAALMFTIWAGSPSHGENAGSRRLKRREKKRLKLWDTKFLQNPGSKTKWKNHFPLLYTPEV